MRRGEVKLEELKLEEVKLGEERGSACLLDWGWVAGLDDIEVGDCRSGPGLNWGADFNIGGAEIFGIE